MSEAITKNSASYEEREKECFEVISIAERDLENNVLPFVSEERKEKINKSFETISEIDDLSERAFILMTYVRELKVILNL